MSLKSDRDAFLFRQWQRARNAFDWRDAVTLLGIIAAVLGSAFVLGCLAATLFISHHYGFDLTTR